MVWHDKNRRERDELFVIFLRTVTVVDCLSNQFDFECCFYSHISLLFKNTQIEMRMKWITVIRAIQKIRERCEPAMSIQKDE